MAFPNVIVECAFDNDVNEYLYASAGYSDISPFVQTISGDLRGRRYEMERVETGSIRVNLDNADGRFTPGRVDSPYYPFVKPARRFRIRGTNRQRLNIAAAGSILRSTRGFVTSEFNDIGLVPVLVPSTGTTSPLRTLVRTNPSPYTLYEFDGDTPETITADGIALSYEWAGTPHTSNALEISHPVGAGTHHIEVTVPAGCAAGSLVQWNVPLEIGRRLTHSAYIWRVSGTESAGTMALRVISVNASGGMVGASIASDTWTLPTSTTPTRKFVAHAAPLDAVRGVMQLYQTQSEANTCVYAIDIISTVDSPNLALNPETQWDTAYWYVTGNNDTGVTSDFAANNAVKAVMSAAGTDSELVTFIGGLVPGQIYTVSVGLRHYTKASGTPTTSLRVTADDGLTFTTAAGQGAFTTVAYTFEATDVRQKFAIQMNDGSDFLDGWQVEAKSLAVIPGSTAPGLHTRGGATFDQADWELPKPIFEGWVEAWPVSVGGAEAAVSVVVNDRLKRLGGITLQNTWREALFSDDMEIMVPFDDDPSDAGYNAAQIGTIAALNQVIEVPFVASHGSIGSSGFQFGVDGPTELTAVEMNPISGNEGYVIPIPHSWEYVVAAAAPAPPPPPPPPAPRPAPTVGTYTTKTYVKTYYATWSQTYKDDGSQRNDTAYMMQGYYESYNGNNRALAGFNYGAIKADLAGATVKSCKVTIHNQSTYAFAGGTAFIGTHIYGSRPSTWAGGSVYERRTSINHGSGATFTKEMGVAVGNEFKAGTTKGIALGPAPSTSWTYYGHYNGASMSAKPFLTITYTKQVLA